MEEIFRIVWNSNFVTCYGCEGLKNDSNVVIGHHKCEICIP